MTALRILYLEDDPHDAELVRETLLTEGISCEMVCVESREQFVRELESRPYQIIFADFSLPSFDGLSALRLAREKRPDIPFIFLSGSMGEELAIESLKSGATDYVLKQRITRLAPVLRRALRDAEEQQALQSAERELVAREQRFRALIENSWDAIVLLNADGIVTYSSPALSRILGYPLAGLENLNLFTLVHPDDRLSAEHAFKSLTTNREPVVSTSLRLRDKQDHWRWLEGTATNLLHEPSVSAIVANWKDVTERRQRERELEAISAVSLAFRTAVRREEISSILLDQVRELVNPQSTDLVIQDTMARDLDALGTAPGVQSGLEDAKQQINGRVLASGEPFFGCVVPGESVTIGTDWVEGNLAIACLPLIVRDHPIGVLWITRGEPLTHFEVRLLDAILNIAANALHRAILYQETERRLNHLLALRAIDLALASSMDLGLIFDVLLKQTTGELKVDAAAVLLLEKETSTLTFGAATGFRSRLIRATRFRPGEGLAGRALMERRTFAVPQLGDLHNLEFRKLVTLEEIVGYAVTPLIIKGAVKGVLEVYHRAPLRMTPEWLSFFETLAGQAAIAIDNAELFQNLQRSNIELTLAYDATIEGWSRALDLRDKETEGHTRRVTEMTLRLARQLNVSDQELVHIRRGALLHDIGKMGIPDSILHKPGPLSPDEWAIMRQHPVYAYQLLSPIAFLRPALDIPYCHHEKWDGSGYPRGLRGEEIPLSARIFAVTDIWDALRSDRPYRPAWTEKETRAHILSLAGSELEERVVAEFMKMLAGA